MRRSTESSWARGGLVSCTRNKNITCFPSTNAHVGPSRSSITLAFEARLARDAWSHQFMELRAVPSVCLTRADEISSQHAARPPLRLATGSSSLRGSITPKFGPLRHGLAKMIIAYGYFHTVWGYIPLGRTFFVLGWGRGGVCRSLASSVMYPFACHSSASCGPGGVLYPRLRPCVKHAAPRPGPPRINS